MEAKALALVQPAFRPAWADAQNALARELKGLPAWLEVQSKLVSSEHHTGKGRPRKEAVSTLQWHIQATVTVKQPQVEQEVRTKACFILATNVLDTAILSDQELVTTYKEQGSVERGFRFLKVPLFLASSVFVKKPECIVALGLIMVLYLLVYRLAEHRLRTRLAETEQTVPDQLNRPTARPTMRLSSFSVLRALNSCISIRSPVRSRSSYVCSPGIASSWLCSDLSTRNSTTSLLESARKGREESVPRFLTPLRPPFALTPHALSMKWARAWGLPLSHCDLDRTGGPQCQVMD